MSAIKSTALQYTYPNALTPTLNGVTFTLPEGALTLVTGVSGVGKSTLLRTLNGLVPHFSGGRLAGQLTVDGLEPYRLPPQSMGQRVGFVFQDPEAQSVMAQVEDEIAFGMEQMGLSRTEMRVRLEEVLDLLGIAHLRSRALTTLSGGERQRVAIAAVLALRPPLMVLDEPTSQLDPLAADELFQALVRLNQDLGISVVVAEHRLERVLPYADYMLTLTKEGPLLGTPREVLPHIEAVPPLVAIARRLGWNPLPLTIKEARPFSRNIELPRRGGSGNEEPSKTTPLTRPPLVEARNVSVNYNGSAAVRAADFALRSGELVAVMGRNGAGKSSLLRTFVGLVRPQAGAVTVGGLDATRASTAELCRMVGYLPQNPNDLLFAETVREEWEFSLRHHGIDPIQGWAEYGAPLADQLGLTDLLHRYPRDLSVGERQRVALGTILLVRPCVLLLDEPTRGLDHDTKAHLADLFRQWRGQGMAIAVITHDVEFAAQVATRVVMMAEGQIVADGNPATVLGNSPLFAPQAARLFPNQGWLTEADVVAGLAAA
jgi:energy-coupling factor transporter ATP-binding protein EcfA2